MAICLAPSILASCFSCLALAFGCLHGYVWERAENKLPAILRRRRTAKMQVEEEGQGKKEKRNSRDDGGSGTSLALQRYEIHLSYLDLALALQALDICGNVRAFEEDSGGRGGWMNGEEGLGVCGAQC